VTGIGIGVAACGSYRTSVVEVKNAPTRVASVSLTVPVSLTTGQTARSVAIPKDAKSAALSGRSIAWFTSSGSAIADSVLIQWVCALSVEAHTTTSGDAKLRNSYQSARLITTQKYATDQAVDSFPAAEKPLVRTNFITVTDSFE
jgi:hypothetical protein